MKHLKPDILLWFVLSFWLAVSAAKAEELWLKDIKTADLQKVYQECQYDGVKGYLMLKTHRYPPVFLKNFPADFNSLTDETERNALFIKILAPLSLKLNEEILQERQIIENLAQQFAKQKKLSEKEQKILEEKAVRYDVFSRLKGDERTVYLLAELLNRVDRIPPSIMITAAALETNWGTSRIVKEANSLYKALIWHDKNGLKPLGETEDDSYRIRVYPDIYASMRDFALKINSHPAFGDLRNFRRERRERTKNISGLLLAPYTYGQSPLKNYAGLFDYTLAYYEFLEIDKSTLDSKMNLDNIRQKFGGYVTKM